MKHLVHNGEFYINEKDTKELFAQQLIPEEVLMNEGAEEAVLRTMTQAIAEELYKKGLIKIQKEDDPNSLSKKFTMSIKIVDPFAL